MKMTLRTRTRSPRSISREERTTRSLSSFPWLMPSRLSLHLGLPGLGVRNQDKDHWHQRPGLKNGITEEKSGWRKEDFSYTWWCWRPPPWADLHSSPPPRQCAPCFLVVFFLKLSSIYCECAPCSPSSRPSPAHQSPENQSCASVFCECKTQLIESMDFMALNVKLVLLKWPTTFSSVWRKTPGCCPAQATTPSSWSPDISPCFRFPPLFNISFRHELLSAAIALSTKTTGLLLTAFQTVALFNNTLYHHTCRDKGHQIILHFNWILHKTRRRRKTLSEPAAAAAAQAAS